MYLTMTLITPLASPQEGSHAISLQRENKLICPREMIMVNEKKVKSLEYRNVREIEE